jgi:hypothetical protein
MALLMACRTPRSGTFSPSLMDEAKQRGWVVISMKNDWKRIFSSEGKQE